MWLDANIFLEIELNRSKSDDCVKLLKSIEREKLTAYTSDFLIYTVIMQMIYHKRHKKQILKFLGLINTLENLHIYRPNFDDMALAIKNTDKYKITFDDSLIFSCMQALKLTKIATLDKDFKKLPVEIIP